MDSKKQQLFKVKLKDLHPTQMSVGYQEVVAKKLMWQDLKHKARKDFLAKHWFPSIMGPEQTTYIIDHHHLGLALHEEEVKHTWVISLKDFSHLDLDEFRLVMAHHHWLHPYDEQGKRHDFKSIPSKITQLKDDPYRSLAARARRAGAYVKESTPFAEFMWADFFRRRIPAADLSDAPEAALAQALTLAHTMDAEHLPGWSAAISSED